MTIAPITAAVGKNGSGKSLALVERVILPSLALGRPVVSNMRIFASTEDAHLPSDERQVHPLWIPLTTPADLIGLRGATIVVDEIQSAFSSRESSKMPAQTVNDLMQLRKGDNLLAWSAPSWMRCDTTIREVTLELVLCSGHLGKKVEGRLWPSNRLFRWRFFDAQDFEEFSVAAAKSEQKGTLAPRRRKWYWRPGNDAHLLYDTYESVGAFEHLDEFGTCTTCRGTRKRPVCKCPPRDSAEAADAARQRRAEAAAAAGVPVAPVVPMVTEF